MNERVDGLARDTVRAVELLYTRNRELSYKDNNNCLKSFEEVDKLL